MKYTIVYRDTATGGSYRIRNQDGLYAGAMRPNCTHFIRSWDEATGAWDYIENHMDDGIWRLVWVQDPDDKPYVGGKPGAPSISHQHAATSQRMVVTDSAAAGWAGMGSVTGRIPSKLPALAATYGPAVRMWQRWAEQRARMASQQPLVWPVIPPHDDGSNEEASTVSEALVQEMAQRVFVIHLVNAIRRY